MITVDEAKRLATEFCQSFGEIASGIFYAAGQPIENSDCYYFKFHLVDKGGNPPKEGFGGAPRFRVDKLTGKAEVLSWPQYIKLKNK